MKLSDLIGQPVHATGGERLGVVHDVLLVQDGPLTNPPQATFRLHGLAIGRRSIGTRLGYLQGHVEHPRLLRLLAPQPPTIIPWRAVISRDNDRIVIDTDQLDEPVRL